MYEDLLEKRPLSAPFVVLDTETTGLHPHTGHRVVEIGAVRYENGEKVAEFSHLLQPGRRMDPDASRVNGIDDIDLLGKPTFADIAPDLLTMLDGALLVAHNAAFDAGFVGMEFFVSGYTNENGNGVPDNPWLCTLLLARHHFYFGRNNLSNIARHLNVRMGRAHRALNDVYMTAEIFKRMTQKLADHKIITIADLLHAQGGAIYTPRSPQTDLPPLLAAALENGRSLHIRYASPTGESHRTITPKYVTENQGIIYLVAYCHTREDQRTFRLDRIVSADFS
ncbi:MAG: WYL domain-containing protein [Anaerolineae bacterium]|nr:WYL domain-containing protein [Anaerolineae bacterium]